MNQLSLPRLTDSQVALQNPLCTHREIACSLGDMALSLSFESVSFESGSSLAEVTPGSPAQSATPGGLTPAVTLKLAVRGTFAWIGLDDVGLFPTLSSLLGGVPFSSLPAEVQVSVAEVAFEPALQALAQALHCDVALVETLATLPSERQLWNVAARLRTGDRETRARLAFGDDLRETLGEAIRTAAPLPVVAWGALPLVATVEFGRTRLTLAELKSLRRFDILLVEQLCGETPESVLLNFGSSAVVPARLDGMQVTITGPAQAASGPVAGSGQPSESASEPGGVQSLDGVEIEVAFEKGEVALTLDGLRNVAAGVTLGLALPADGQRVGLRSGGGRLGFGELVSVGNRLGVRLLEIR